MGGAALVTTGRILATTGALVMLASLVGCMAAGAQAGPVLAFWAGGAIQVAGLALERRGTYGRWLL